jgi:hypothetical protein
MTRGIEMLSIPPNDNSIRIPAAEWRPSVNCQEALELMGDHVDETLGVWDRWRLRIHLVVCRACRRYLASYRAAIRLAKSVGFENANIRDDPISDAHVASILKATRRQ